MKKSIENKKLNKTLNIVLVIILSLLAISIIILCVMNSIIKTQKKKEITAYEHELKESFVDDSYMYNLVANENVVCFQVNDSFINLTNKEKLEVAEQYVEICTGKKVHYKSINSGNYVSIVIYSMSGIELVKSDHKGKIEIVF